MPLRLTDMLFQLYGIRTYSRVNPVVSDVDIAVTKILKNDPQRVSFVFFNLSGNAMYIAPDNSVSSTRGIFIAPNGGSVSLTWDRDFELCSLAWYATAAADNSACFTLENRIGTEVI